MTDKDFVGRSVVGDEFRDARLLLCLFHMLWTFQRQISCQKMSLQFGEHKYVLELLQKIACSKSEVECDELYEQLLQCWHRSVICL